VPTSGGSTPSTSNVAPLGIAGGGARRPESGADSRGWAGRHAPRESQSAGRSRRLATDCAVILLLVALVCVPVWPGVFTIDSQAIYEQAVADDINNWYAPVLGWVWGVAHHAGLPPSAMLVAGVAGVAVALLATYRVWLGVAASRFATICTVLWPPVYGILSWVGRDVWFLALLLGVIALLGWAAKLPDHRWSLVAIAAVPAWLAFDARQNGFPVLALWGGIAAWWAMAQPRWRWAVVPIAVLLVLGASAGIRLAAHAAIDVRRMYPEQYTYYRDLLAVSVALDQSQLPRSLFPSQDLDAVRRLPQIDSAFAGTDPPLVAYNPYEEGERLTARIADAWLNMVRKHPLSYLEVRVRLHAEQLTIGTPARSTYFATSDELNTPLSHRFRQSFPGLNERRLGYLDVYEDQPGVGGPLHTVWVYLLIGLVSASVIASVPGPTRVLGAGVLLLQVTLQGVLAFLAPVVQYRFELYQVVLGIVLAICAIAAIPRFLRQLRHRAVHAGLRNARDGAGEEGGDARARKAMWRRLTAGSATSLALVVREGCESSASALFESSATTSC
jgi:hypothetical protein